MCRMYKKSAVTFHIHINFKVCILALNMYVLNVTAVCVMIYLMVLFNPYFNCMLANLNVV